MKKYIGLFVSLISLVSSLVLLLIFGMPTWISFLLILSALLSLITFFFALAPEPEEDIFVHEGDEVRETTKTKEKIREEKLNNKLEADNKPKYIKCKYCKCKFESTKKKCPNCGASKYL